MYVNSAVLSIHIQKALKRAGKYETALRGVRNGIVLVNPYEMTDEQMSKFLSSVLDVINGVLEDGPNSEN